MTPFYSFIKTPGPGHPTCGARYFLHRDGTPIDGWFIDHCGHPTANWPYSFFYNGKGLHGYKDLRKLKLSMIELHKRLTNEPTRNNTH